MRYHLLVYFSLVFTGDYWFSISINRRLTVWLFEWFWFVGIHSRDSMITIEFTLWLLPFDSFLRFVSYRYYVRVLISTASLIIEYFSFLHFFRFSFASLLLLHSFCYRSFASLFAFCIVLFHIVLFIWNWN